MTQFLTPSTSTKAAVAIATGVVAYKVLKLYKISAKGTGKASVK
ncbi:hypothetical protein [Clostridium aciditolerans]|nr:hypothetical protein [Clostridium aciditolerans]